MLEGFGPDPKQETYHVLARRTRPQSFSELVGQEVVAKAIESMIESARIPHAFLFSGTRGTGKTSSARILAKSLCCIEGPTSHPCQKCVHCVQITACAHDDILEIDGASHTGVDNIRELREAARFFPNSSRYKVFIIDEVHMLSIGAFNALLKILEEPPPNVVFVLATTELHKVPVTVRSRCMIFSFRKVEVATIAAHLKGLLLKEGLTFDDDALVIVAREAKGSIRDSLSLLEQVMALCGGNHIDVENTRRALSMLGAELADQLFQGIVAKDAGICLDILKQADLASLDLPTLLEDTAARFRAGLIIRQVADEQKARNLTQLLPQEFEGIKSASSTLSVAAFSEIFRTLITAAKDVGRSANGLPWSEVAVLDCVSRADWLSASELTGLFAGKLKGGESSQNVSRFERPSDILVKASTEPLQNVPNREVNAPINSAIDHELFVRFLTAIEARNRNFAAKLRHATLDAFNSVLIQFADTPQNKLFTTFAPADAEIFVTALRELGLGDVPVKNLDLPRRSGPGPSAALNPPGAVPAREVSREQSHLIPPPLNRTPNPQGAAASRSLFNRFQGQDAFSASQTLEEKKAAFAPPHRPHSQENSRAVETKNGMLPDQRNMQKAQGGGFSLANFEQEKRNEEFLEKEKAMRQLPAVQRLSELATSLEFVPLGEED
jgi:DNA polymerase-3 subunit gamma/tau